MLHQSYENCHNIYHRYYICFIKAYKIGDDQSNRTLAKSELFDYLNIHSESKEYRAKLSLSKPNLLLTTFYVQNKQVFGVYRLNKQRFPHLVFYFKFGFYRILFY